MIHRFYLYMISLALLAAGCQVPARPSPVSAQMKRLLAQNDYFRLSVLFRQRSHYLDEVTRQYFKAFLANAFNRNNECVGAVDAVFKYPNKLTDSAKFALKQMQGDSYFKLFQYQKAARCDSEILNCYSHTLAKETLDDVKNDLQIREALCPVPVQECFVTANTTIRWSRNKLGLIEIPVSTPSLSTAGIFDTGANLSSVTESYAKKLGLRMINVTFDETGGATGAQFKSGISIADTLRIGDILLKNVVFQVMPDAALYIAPLKFQINFVIGFPVIAQLVEIHIFRNGEMTIPLSPFKTGLHNLALDGLQPLISLKAGNDTLPFNFDSGARSSVLYASYYKKYRNLVEKTAARKTVGFAGAGGSQRKEVYILPKLNLTLGTQTAEVENIPVLKEKITPDEKFYGNIGQDFTGKFSEVIYNFKDMYIKGVL